VIYIGLDDTDAPGTLGTKRLARILAAELGGEYRCRLIVRHQLLVDPRVPCTTKNSTAAIMLEARNSEPSRQPPSHGSLIDRLGGWVRERYTPGSDPGLCVTETVPAEVTNFGKRCQRELVGQPEARDLAARHGMYLEGFGGTEDGVIGALAAVGLAAEGDDGRVLQVGEWPDDLAGPQPVEALRARGVEVRSLATGEPVLAGNVDVGKRLRPNYRHGRVVLFVHPIMPCVTIGCPREQTSPVDTPSATGWQAVRLT